VAFNQVELLQPTQQGVGRHLGALTPAGEHALRPRLRRMIGKKLGETERSIPQRRLRRVT
jgi:hypothetical protein